MYIKTLFYLSGWITGQVLLTPLYIFIYISELKQCSVKLFSVEMGPTRTWFPLMGQA